MRNTIACSFFFAVLIESGCTKTPEPTKAVAVSGKVEDLPGHESLRVDNSHKEGPRTLSAESYIRSYLFLFGGLSPIDSQTALRGSGATVDTTLFDTWSDYLGALGMPDYREDIARSSQTNALMIAAFERIGVALCDRAAEHDLKNGATPATVFTFKKTAALPTRAEFDERFDVLHRRFLGYPAKLAPTDRGSRFFTVFSDASGTAADAGVRLTGQDAGWTAVCYGLIRHPEFHLY